MHKDTIISKGKYAHEQPEQLISLKQYMFVRNEKGKKQLLLRFANERNEVCTGFEFVLSLMDAKGNVIREERLESAADTYPAGTSFGFDHPIQADERCTDFRVRLLRASFGDYTYRVENAGVLVSYEKTKQLAAEAQGKHEHRPPRVHMRKIKMPWLCAVLALLVLAAMFATFGYLLHEYMDGNMEFSLSGVKYEFVSDNTETGEVEITGYSGLLGNILLPSEIEGHPVIGIREGAFDSNFRVRRVRVENLNIPATAFRDCGNLESVELVGVVSIGNEAFYNCNSLTSLTADTLESIGDRAFYECDALQSVSISHKDTTKVLSIGKQAFGSCMSLKDVSIRQLIDYPSAQDIFADDTALETLHLHNFASSVGGLEIEEAHKGTLSALFGENQTRNMMSLREVSIDYMDTMVPGFCAGFAALQSVKLGRCEFTEIPATAFSGCTSLSSLEMPYAMTSVGKEAFKNTALLSFNGEKLQTIGESAFEGCRALREITLPLDGPLVFVGSSAFKGCSALKTVNIPIGITDLPDTLFAGCASLESVAFAKDSTIAAIPTQAFANCLLLGEIELPATVTDIGAAAFTGCEALVSVTASDALESFGDGAFEGCSSLTDVTMSEKLLSIGARAFAYTALEGITVPDSVTVIGLGAFEGCEKMTQISVPFLGMGGGSTLRHFAYIFGADTQENGTMVPASLKSVTVRGELTALPAYAFYGCASVKEFSLPDGISEIGNYAFANCKALTTFDLSDITELGDYAFWASGLRSVTIPQSITVLPWGVFSECQSLAEVSLPATLLEIGMRAFSACTSLEALQLPASLTSIGSEAFASSALRSIALPASVTSVSSRTFYACSALSGVTMSRVTSIGEFAFADCSALTDILLPSTLQRIGAQAFAKTGLRQITLPASVQSVGYGAYAECSAIAEATLPFIGASASSSNAYLGYIFGGSNESAVPAALKRLTVSGGSSVTLYTGALRNCSDLEELVLGDGVTRIASNAVSHCDRLLFVSLPSTLSTLESDAFSNCYHLFELENLSYFDIARYGIADYALEIRDSVQERSPRVTVGNYRFARYSGAWYLIDVTKTVTAVTFPTTVSYQGNAVQWRIPSYFFYTNDVVKSVTAPAALVAIGDYAFAQSAVENVTLDRATSLSGIATYTFAWCYSLQQVLLPSSVQEIASNAFYSCQALQTLRLSSALTSIGEYAFAYCNALTQLSLPASVETIGRNCFYYCSGLQSVALSSALTSIGEYAFAYCNALTQLSLPASVETIGQYCFYYCSGLQSVALSASLKTLGSYAFANCSKLARVTCGDQLTSIGQNAFYRCSALAQVTLSAALQSIGASAFYDCDALVRITLPNSVLSIGERAFYDCDKLSNLVLSSQLQTIGANAFFGCENLYDVYYTGSSLSLEAGYVDAWQSYVARYAVTIHRDLSEEASTEITLGGDLVFRHWNGLWLLIRYTGTRTELSLAGLTCNSVAVSNIRIRESVFADNYTLRKLVLGEETVQIQQNAFRNCDALREVIMQGSNLNEIEGYAFYDCDALRYVTLASSIRTIGACAFGDCNLLQRVVMPEALTTIGERAFLGCAKLLSVTLHSNVSSIGADAFRNCTQLFEVYDLSSSITVGKNSAYGYVGNYAKRIYNTLSDALPRTEQASCTFVYADGIWYLYTCALDLNVSMLTVPDLGDSLVILENAFEGARVTSLVLPENLTAIQSAALSDIADLGNVYYRGSSSQWRSVSGYSNVYASVWYYAECVHEGGIWTYDGNDNIRTAECTLTWSETQASTCYAAGVMTSACDCDCGYTEIESIPMLTHEYEDDVCKHCEGERVYITQENFESFVESGRIVNDADYAYEISENRIASTNEDSGTTSSLILNVTEQSTLGFLCGISAQHNDYLRIYVNGDLLVSKVGTDSATYSGTLLLAAGDTVEFRFTKSYSTLSTSGEAWILDMYLVS